MISKLYNYTVRLYLEMLELCSARIELYNPGRHLKLPPAPAIIFYRSDNWLVINIRYSSHTLALARWQHFPSKLLSMFWQRFKGRMKEALWKILVQWAEQWLMEGTEHWVCIISENSGQGLPPCLRWLEGNRDAASSSTQVDGVWLYFNKTPCHHKNCGYNDINLYFSCYNRS